MLAPHERVLEGLVTTENEDGSVNLAPMGPVTDDCQTHFLLKPFQTSTTYANLKRTGKAAFHVTDDVAMLAAAAIGRLSACDVPEMRTEQGYHIVGTACRWYGLEVVDQVIDTERAQFACSVVAIGTLREYFGLNRAKHAVLEAAILATRIRLLPPAEIEEQLSRLRPWVEKTGALVEHQAFEMLTRYVRENQVPE
ncbi:MAG: DUF447 domain-containing protein [Pirellulaceae bacterium]